MEVLNYIEELQKVVGKKEEIAKILEDTPNLQQYFEHIGIRPEITKNPGFIYLIKKEMGQLIERDTAIVTEKGIISTPKNFLKAGNNGELEFLLYSLGDEGFIKSTNYDFDSQTGNVRYIEDTELLKTTIIMGSNGVMNKKTKMGKTPYMEDFSEEERKVENGIPIITSTITNTLEGERKSKHVDFGNPFTIDVNFSTNEFDENYAKYVEAYPELESWYQERFQGFENDIKGYSDNLRKEQLKIEIQELERRIEIQESTFRVKHADVISLKEKLRMMLSLLENKGEKNPLIKPAVKQIFFDLEEKNDGNAIPESPKSKTEVPEEKKNETLEEKKKRLLARLERIREDDINSNRYYSELKSVIDSLKIQITNIPFIGASLANKINQEVTSRVPRINEKVEKELDKEEQQR